ncbi:hypothetical protein [Actinopolyspora mortivallis]|uniref:hypothetical protein n=1 Tax=Actinopolyspora mortivallis TaxID=33906 RepID=UPI0009FFC950|nr:hypothetical protein [Actinopolyspora mortivallis]
MAEPMSRPAESVPTRAWWPRRLSWSGTLPLAAAVRRRPGSRHLPGRQSEPSSPLSLSPDRALLARVLAELRAL